MWTDERMESQKWEESQLANMSAAVVENPTEENGFTVDLGSRLAIFEQQEQGDFGRPPIGRTKNRGFRMFQAPTEKCTTCDKRVYEMEKITADDKVYHKGCFRCAKCNRTLGLGNYAALEGQTFCKPHFIELFKKKGNYEEGFGKERHKNKWLTPTGSRETTPRPEETKHVPTKHVAEESRRAFSSGNRKPSVDRESKPSVGYNDRLREETTHKPRVKDDETVTNGRRPSYQDKHKTSVVDDELDAGLVHASRIEISNGRYDTNGHAAEEDEIELPRDDAKSKRESFHFKNMSSVKSMWESGEVHPREDDIPEYRRDLQEVSQTSRPRGALRARYEMAVKESEVATARKVAPAKSVPDLRDSPDREMSLPSSREGSVSKDDMDDLPKPGKMKSLLAKFKSMENVSKDKPLAPPKPRNITPPREASPKPNRYRSISRSDSEKEDQPPLQTREIIRSDDQVDDGIPHTSSMARNMAAKFQQIEHEHEVAQARDRVHSTSSLRSRKSSTAEEDVFHATPVVSHMEPVEPAKYDRQDDALSPRSQYSEPEEYGEEDEEEHYINDQSVEQEYINYSNEQPDEYQGSYEDHHDYSHEEYEQQQQPDEQLSYNREYAENSYDSYTEEQLEDMAHYNSNNNNNNAYYGQYYSQYTSYPEQYDNYMDYTQNSHFYPGYYDEISGQYGYYNPDTQQFLPYDQCDQYAAQYGDQYDQYVQYEEQGTPDQTVCEPQVLPASERSQSEIDACVSVETVQLARKGESIPQPMHRKLDAQVVERPPEKPARSSSKSVLSRYQRNVSTDATEHPPAFGSYFGHPAK
ncbi:F-actin-monooxygenase MICAL3 [Lingula anatina]|uniref:F-actin-monooxygenase MICAL3 n=1 Tax=Lingula anatina TaxID=7574 RepID=A0A1S3J2A1_LINAN|nr:F-actin-monooxygenase MICAL3 [Lingula anatina]|eukprot:XP_013404542.1 F-actin-monooxygenase MICAL3 [Lingula anatina]